MGRDRFPELPRLRLAAVLAAGTLALTSCVASLPALPWAQAAAEPPFAPLDAGEGQEGATLPTLDRHGRTKDDDGGIGPLPLLALRF